MMFFQIFLLIIWMSLIHAKEPIKALHLTFHKGCANEVAALSNKLSIDLTTWLIPELPLYFFDGYSSGNALYNIGHKRAEEIWLLHKDFFNQFDLIFTSDTAVLSRIFLQNDSKIPLIIWMCNRFDYSFKESLDCEFPDQEYYDLFNAAKDLPHVKVVANTPFEHAYARSKGVDSGMIVIKPAGFYESDEGIGNPSSEDRENIFYLPKYHNEEKFMNLQKKLQKLKVKSFCGRHNGFGDLQAYKGIVHLPYSWSTIALFENIKLGMLYFIPSKEFFKTLMRAKGYWHQNNVFLSSDALLSLSEWYLEENKDLFIYFDSWRDLKNKIDSCNYLEKRRQVKDFSKKHQEKSLSDWHMIIEKVLDVNN